MKEPRKVIRNLFEGEEENSTSSNSNNPGKDQLTVDDLMDHNIGKGILVGDTWYEVVAQDKEANPPRFKLKLADYDESGKQDDGEYWVSFPKICKMVNAGKWGFQVKNENKGKKGWLGKQSPRHIGRLDNR